MNVVYETGFGWREGEEGGLRGSHRSTTGGCIRGLKGVLVVKIGFHPPVDRYVLRRCFDCAAVALVVVWCGV